MDTTGQQQEEAREGGALADDAVEDRSLSLTTFLWAVVGVIIVQVIAVVAVKTLIESSAEEGQFGDLFGVTNSTFSGIAFAGLVYTILLQREELRLQRKELSLTRAEVARGARAQEKSEQALDAQARAAEHSARLSSINFLIGRYDERAAKLLKLFQPGGVNPRVIEESNEIQRRIGVLEDMVQDLFNEIAPKENSDVRKSDN
jgi:hypothetical protein